MINFATESVESGQNQYLLHASAALEDANHDMIGEIIFTRYNAEAAEAEGSSPRFIARPDTYLYRLSTSLFDPGSPVTRLPSLIREDLDRGTGKVVIIDDICIDIETTTKETLDILRQAIFDFRHSSDLLLVPDWSLLGRRLNILPTDLLMMTQRFGMVPFNVHTLIGFCDDFELHARNDDLRQSAK